MGCYWDASTSESDWSEEKTGKKGRRTGRLRDQIQVAGKSFADGDQFHAAIAALFLL